MYIVIEKDQVLAPDNLYDIEIKLCITPFYLLVFNLCLLLTHKSTLTANVLIAFINCIHVIVN